VCFSWGKCFRTLRSLGTQHCGSGAHSRGTRAPSRQSGPACSVTAKSVVGILNQGSRRLARRFGRTAALLAAPWRAAKTHFSFWRSIPSARLRTSICAQSSGRTSSEGKRASQNAFCPVSLRAVSASSLFVFSFMPQLVLSSPCCCAACLLAAEPAAAFSATHRTIQRKKLVFLGRTASYMFSTTTDAGPIYARSVHGDPPEAAVGWAFLSLQTISLASSMDFATLAAAARTCSSVWFAMT